VVVVNPERCVACQLCVRICAKQQAISLNRQLNFVQVDGDKCTDCGACEKVCPFSAIGDSL